MSNGESVAVIGAGLVGCLAAMAMAKEGYAVSLYEYRADLRKCGDSEVAQKSINLAISARGIEGLRSVLPECVESMLKQMLPMQGRMIHYMDGSQAAQQYGLFGECINSIDRRLFNCALLDEVEGMAGISMHFEHKLKRIYFGAEKQKVVFMCRGAESEKEFDFVLGCDGAYSATRAQMQRKTRMNYSQEYIDCCYLELYVPSRDSGDDEDRFPLSPKYLHIWPRGNLMLIALPNVDGSFNATFFGPWSLFDRVNTTALLQEFLTTNFPDAMKLIGLEKAVATFTNNEKSALLSVECSPYHLDGGKAILLGDAAHSMVPFYGQGMNCGFEDVRVLMELLRKHNFNRSLAFSEYSATRHRDLKSILDLAKQNFKEMSHDVVSLNFRVRRTLSRVLGKIFANKWVPLYSMVSFRADIPYHRALYLHKQQSRILTFLQILLLTASAFCGHSLLRNALKCAKLLRRPGST